MRNEVKIGVGVGQIIFGMTRNEIVQMLGTPDIVENSTYINDEKRKIFRYESNGIEFSFDSDYGYKLISIDIEDSRYLIGDAGSIIGLSLNDILRIFERRGFTIPTIDCISNEYEPNHLMLYYDKESITISFINYICDSFSIGPFWKNDDEILWPSDLNNLKV